MKAQELFKKLLFVAGCSALVCAVNVTNSHAASASASASGKVIAPITISKTADLDFGSFASGSTLGTVVLPTDGGTRTKSGGVILAGGTPTAAVFHVTGEAGSSYSFTMDPLTLTSGGNSMTVALASSLGGATGTVTGGAVDITVAGTLSVAANQAAGTYSGTLNATVEYN